MERYKVDFVVDKMKDEDWSEVASTCREGIAAGNAGASEQELLEAIEVGIEMGGGPATVSARFALEIMKDVYKN